VSDTQQARHISFAQAGDLLRLRLKHGSMALEYYAPFDVDHQTPHTKDEIYIIMHGHGWFRHGAERVAFAEGDALFVPAGLDHKFEEFSKDFATWVIFYGTEGGEQDIPAPI